MKIENIMKELAFDLKNWFICFFGFYLRSGIWKNQVKIITILH